MTLTEPGAAAARHPAGPPGFANLRDLGGLPAGPGRRTRAGRLVRADLPDPADADQLADLERAGVRTAVDLRDADEVALQPSPFAAVGWAVHHRPLFAGSAASAVGLGTTLDALYEDLVEHRGTVIAEVARVVATSDGGVLVHCTAGKDRTGLTVALLLSAVGVPDDAAVADYARTQEQLAGPWLARRLAVLSAFHGRDLSDHAELLGGSPPRVLRTALRRVTQGWGSAAGYLRAHGLGARELVVLRERLTVEDDA